MSASTSLLTFGSIQNDSTATSDLNQNFAAVNTALGNCLALNGQAPNQMQATLDMNSNRIINLPIASSATEPVTLATFQAAQVQTSLTPINNNSVLGNVSGSTALPVSINQSQLATLVALTTFTTTANGSVPFPGSGVTTKYLRSDGTWQNNLNGLNLTIEPSVSNDQTTGVTYGTIAVNTVPSISLGSLFVNTNPATGAAVWRGLGYYDANNNYFWGRGSGASITSGLTNTCIGFISGRLITSGSDNILMGANAGQSITTGLQNVVIGSGAGVSITADTGHTLVGFQAGQLLNSGSQTWNTFIGHVTGSLATTCGGCIAIGRGAGHGFFQDTDSLAIGHGAIFYNNGWSAGTSGQLVQCTAIGGTCCGMQIDGTATNWLGTGLTYWGAINDTSTIWMGDSAGKSSAAGRTNCFAIGHVARVPIKDNTGVLGHSMSDIHTSGRMWSGGPTNFVAYSADSNSVFAAADLVGGLIRRSGMTATRTDTTDSAANIVAAGPGSGADFNVGRWVYINNIAANNNVLAAGTGVTIQGTATITTNTCGIFWMIITNSQAGSEAVTFVRANA